MTPWRWPRPRYALYEAPEVAAIDALGIVVEMTTALLETACPELRDGQTLPWDFSGGPVVIHSTAPS